MVISLFHIFISLALAWGDPLPLPMGPPVEASSGLSILAMTTRKNASVPSTPLAAPSTSSDDNSTETPLPTLSTKPPIGDPNIFGCTWPDDFETRYEYCAKKSGVQFAKKEAIHLRKENHVREDDVKYGLLDPSILDDLGATCSNESLVSCVKPVAADKLAAFATRWQSNAGATKIFQSCLQENTEAMNRLCNVESQVGKVVSGAAGLQLNLIGALERVQELPGGQNLSTSCFQKMIETVHITAALYLQSEHYMDNSVAYCPAKVHWMEYCAEQVLCWNVVNKECGEECSAFAQQLNCLLSQCPEVPLRVFQEFGIWQWYYLNAQKAGEMCQLEGKKCKNIEDEGMGGSETSALFNMDNLKRRLNEMSESLEHTFNLPFSVLMAIAVSAFFAFCGSHCLTFSSFNPLFTTKMLRTSALMLCAWKYGLCGIKKKRKLRYSRLDEGEEAKSLTELPDQLLD